MLRRPPVPPTSQLLVAGTPSSTLTSICERLVARGYEVLRFETAQDCVRRFSGHGAELIICCLPVPGAGGKDLLRALHEVDPQVAVIAAGSDNQLPGSAEAFQAGAFEHIQDAGGQLTDLLAAVGTALGGRRGDAQLRYMREREASLSSWTKVVGTSKPMLDVIHVLRRVSERTTRGIAPTLLLQGETGTGKGLVAKCIHYNGPRRNHTFVELNCAAIPGTLLESELFGHERGTFTDARSARPGLFETAHRGTLFLDEIGALPLDLQTKLLTVLEERQVRRLGGRQSTSVDVQIIAATHPGLAERVRQQTFRADLYHRLNVVSVLIPPLRKRGEDALQLAEVFLEARCREYGIPTIHLSEDARDYIREYHWPGNVRELKNQIERIVLLGTGSEIEADQFDRMSLPPPSARAPRRVTPIPPGAREDPPSSRRRPSPLVMPKLDGFGDQSPPSSRSATPAALPRPSPPPLLEFEQRGLGLEEVEREMIERALARHAGNVSRAAKDLKVTRQTLMYRIKKHGLSSEE